MVEDLSNHHELVSRLFSLPSTAEGWEQYRLSGEQVQFFHEHGYLKGIRVLGDDQVEILRQEFEELMDTAHAGRELFYEFHENESIDREKRLFHALGAWRIMSGFHDLLWHPAFTVPAAQLLGGTVRFWHDQLFGKPAFDGGVVAWHQDYSYWTRTVPLAHLTCWIGLDDSTLENGCLHYIPGSHLWPELPVTGLTGDMDAIQRVLTEEQKEQFRPLAIELKKGECSFHHPRMIHGSYENRSDKVRRGTVINAFLDGVISDTNEPLLKGVPVIPRGEKIEGRFFPLLTDTKGEPQS